MNGLNEGGVLESARKRSLMTQRDMCEVLNVSVPTMGRYESDPGCMSLGNWKKFYDAVGNDGKEEMRSYINSFFATQL